MTAWYLSRPNSRLVENFVVVMDKARSVVRSLKREIKQAEAKRGDDDDGTVAPSRSLVPTYVNDPTRFI